MIYRKRTVICDEFYYHKRSSIHDISQTDDHMWTKFVSHMDVRLWYIANERPYVIHFITTNGRPFVIYHKRTTVCELNLNHIWTSVYDISHTGTQLWYKLYRIWLAVYDMSQTASIHLWYFPFQDHSCVINLSFSIELTIYFMI